ncbi:MAG: hypothetical protein VYA34_15560 [Myxococcota bacterium]|nr:hypothetical protein [Myxococcota bacterium]
MGKYGRQCGEKRGLAHHHLQAFALGGMKYANGKHLPEMIKGVSFIETNRMNEIDDPSDNRKQKYSVNLTKPLFPIKLRYAAMPPNLTEENQEV